MNGGELIRDARFRARLTQRELAERLATTQAQIARWERGKTSPPFRRVVEAIRACGFELAMRIIAPDPEHTRQIEENLRLTPSERLERLGQR